MRVRFHQEGGLAHLPGLARPREVEVEPELAEALEAALAEGVPEPRPLPDARTYVIEVERGGGWQRAVLRDPLPPRWAEVVRRLRRP